MTKKPYEKFDDITRKPAGIWTHEYEAIAEHLFWSPEQINRQRGYTVQPWSKIWAKLKRREVPLNHLFNIFFQLAPDELGQRIIARALPDFPVRDLILRPLRDHELSGICQPDFLFTTGDHLIFIEMKVTAKLSVEQIVKYALAAAALKPPGRIALVCLGPASSFQSVNADLGSGPNGVAIDGKMRRFCDQLAVQEHELRSVLSRLEVSVLSYNDLGQILAEDIVKSQASDQARHRLCQGILAELQNLELLKDSSRADSLKRLRRHLAHRPISAASEPAWATAVRGGDFTAIPRDIAWNTSSSLAH
jgi:hypothetical protein